MIYYKLTDQKMQTHNGFQWELGKWFSVKGGIIEAGKVKHLCTSGYFHCYNHPLLAILHNPIHADIINPRLFEAEVGGWGQIDNGMKYGFQWMRLKKEFEPPKITKEQFVRYGILTSLEVCNEPTYVEWAKNWLSGQDRTKKSAAAAAAEKAARAEAASAAKVKKLNLIEIAERAMKGV